VSLVRRLGESRFLRFAMVGTAGFLVNEAALAFALKLLHLNSYAGGVFSFAVAVTFTWWGNRRLTFRDRAATGPRGMLVEWAKFVMANGLGFLVNFGLYAGLIALAPRPLNNPFLALALGTIAGLLFNFAMSSRVVFGSGSGDAR
jgi:putative flippase GtrA